MNGIIYKATSPSNKSYYGQTKNSLNERKEQHLKKSRIKNTYFYSAIKKYGIDNFKWEIVDRVNNIENEKELRKRLDDLEKKWIRKDKTHNKKYGYNMTPGGGGGDTILNHPDRDLIIEKRRIANKGQKRSEEFKKRLSEIVRERNSLTDPEIFRKRSLKGRKTLRKRIEKEGLSETEKKHRKKCSNLLTALNKTDKRRKEVSEQMKKRKVSQETRNKLSEKMSGRKISEKTRLKLCKSISIDEINYESLTQASKILGIPKMTIRNRLINDNFAEYRYN